jgi:hypothetical protein
MPSSGMLRCVALIRTDVWEDGSASIIRVTRIGELGTTLSVTKNIYTRTTIPALGFITKPPIQWIVCMGGGGCINEGKEARA